MNKVVILLVDDENGFELLSFVRDNYPDVQELKKLQP